VLGPVNSRWMGPVAASLVVITLTTATLMMLDIASEPQHLIFGYLVPTSFIAVRYGSAPAMLTSVASSLCAAFFLYPPKFNIYMANPLHMAELTFFLLLALAASRFIGGFADDDRKEKRGPRKGQ
jgi:two-component system, OmpR family, sensor histidine kinase KdpD